jgi:hypothetical protein
MIVSKASERRPVCRNEAANTIQAPQGLSSDDRGRYWAERIRVLKDKIFEAAILQVKGKIGVRPTFVRFSTFDVLILIDDVGAGGGKFRVARFGFVAGVRSHW